MKEVILADPEDTGEFLVVASHQSCFGGLFPDLHDIINILHRAEALRPQLQPSSRLELRKTRLKMKFDTVVVPSFPSSETVGRLKNGETGTKIYR